MVGYFFLHFVVCHAKLYPAYCDLHSSNEKNAAVLTALISLNAMEWIATLVRTLACLGLYWFSRSEMDRAKIHINHAPAVLHQQERVRLPCKVCSNYWASGKLLAIIMQTQLISYCYRSKIQILVKQRPENLKITELEELSAAASRIYGSHEYFPSFGRTPIKSDSQLLGLHSLYHLCRMVVISPLVSLFSGRRQSIPTIVDNGPANAAIVAQHALQHCRMIREYMSSSYDLTKVTPLIAFASFVATSLILTLIQSSKHRCHAEEAESRRTLAQISLYAQDTCHLLTTLQTYWYPLRSMVSNDKPASIRCRTRLITNRNIRLKHCIRSLKSFRSCLSDPKIAHLRKS
ncbi:Uncharacterized protein HZ326_30356 [Fusarium oxysporum f. sp. albedinis]|nr:Uncharacterized protein HZ326_30356 [Fusarium oxysporum f. sp. albedinis]